MSQVIRLDTVRAIGSAESAIRAARLGGGLPDIDRRLLHALADAARSADERRRARRHLIRTVVLVLAGIAMGYVLRGLA